MTTVYVSDPRYIDHQHPFGYQHPERPERLQAVWQALEVGRLLEKLDLRAPRLADDEAILAVHSADYLALINSIGQAAKPVMIDADTYALPISAEIARLAAGGVLVALDAVLRGEADNALAAVRPPGHHATPVRPMGFCLFNNVAIAARYAQRVYGIERVMIVDYDVHHGNGTQDIFYQDPSVLFVSLHQSPFYPGSGLLDEVGRGAGYGYTLNVPFSAGNGDANYQRVFENVIAPAAQRFRPQLILVSAGFDAHWADPLAQMGLTLTGYAHLSRMLLGMAQALCGGNIAFILEGGYNLAAVGNGMRNVAHVLLGQDTISDPIGSSTHREPDVGLLMERLLETHGL